MWHPSSRCLFIIAVGIAGAAGAEIPIVGHVAAATTVLHAIRASEVGHGTAGVRSAPFATRPGSGGEGRDMIAAGQDCRLVALDGWDSEHVNSLWQCGGRSDFRMFVLKDGRVAVQN
jgi:hypothetical protein